MKCAEDTKTVVWMGIELSVPGDWEIIRHGMHPEKGSLIFIDRSRERLQLKWRHCPAAPDLAGSRRDYLAHTREHHPDWRAERIGSPRGWYASVLAVPDRPAIIKALFFDSPASLLLDMGVLADPELGEDKNAALAERIMKTCRVVAPPREARTWRAFGIHVGLPSAWQVVSVTALPMEVTFRCRPRVRRRRGRGDCAEITRRGLADIRFSGTEETWVRGSGFAAPPRLGAVRIGPHKAVTAAGWEACRTIDRLLKRRRRRREMVWRCEKVNSVFHVTTLTRFPNAPGPEEFPVACECECAPRPDRKK